MQIPGNEEPGAISRQQQAQHQQSMNYSSAIPLKKRRFPMFQPASPPQEEKPCNNDDEKREPKIPQDEGISVSIATNTNNSIGNSDVSKTSGLIVKKEEVTPANIELARANVNPLASKPQEGVSLVPTDDLRNKIGILSNEKSAIVPEVSGLHVTNVKKEIVSGLELSRGAMNIELSIGRKEPVVPVLQPHNTASIGSKPDNCDPSLLSLTLSKEKLSLQDNTVKNVSSGVCANRSNWDLNTPMDSWESSSNSDASAHRFGDIVGFSKTHTSHDAKSSLTTAGTVDLFPNKGKDILDESRTNSCNTNVQQFQQDKTDDSVGLRLGMPFMELGSRGKSLGLSDKLVSSSIGPNINLLSAMNLTMASGRTVKSEPVDENSKRDSSIGSRSSSSNMGLSKFSSVKRELVVNQSRETLVASTIIPQKLFDHGSVKSELVQEGNNQEAFKPKNATLHQESCASSSAFSLPSMPQNSCPSKLSTCSELTTISGELSSQSEHSFHSKEAHDPNGKPVNEDGKHLMARIDEHTLELCGPREVTTNDDEKISISAEMLQEDSLGSDCESHENNAVDTSIAIGRKIHHKEDEYEDGEIREPLQLSAKKDPITEGKNTGNVELEGVSRNLQSSVDLGDQKGNTSVFVGKAAVSECHDETHSDTIEESVMIDYEPHSEDNNSLPKLPGEELEVGVDEKRCINVTTPEKQLDVSGRENVEEGPRKEVSSERPTIGSHGIEAELGDGATDKMVTEICSEKHDSSTLNKVEASVNNNDAAKDPNILGNKSRIINLARASVGTSPCKTKPTPNRLLASSSGKERCSDLDGEVQIQPRGNRNEVYTGGSNKFARERDYDHSFRNNSRQNFTRGRGRGPGRFGSFRREWDSDHDFASEIYNNNGPSDYRAVRHNKHASSSVSDDCNGYGSSNRRKPMNDEFPSSRRTSFRRLSPEDRDGPVTRGNNMVRRIPRNNNISPSRGNVEDGSNFVGFRHGDKFMRHLSEDMMDPVYDRPVYNDELDRGNRNFSTMQQRKGYHNNNPRMRSKSPIRSRTRSPGGPWSSPPRRRSSELNNQNNNNRSPAMYRKMRSPDRSCFRDEMVSRRRGSPSFVSSRQHPNDLRDVDSHVPHHHNRSSGNSSRRSPPARVFQRRRGGGGDALDSREMGDNNGDEFIERSQRPVRFRPSYSSGGDGDSFQFHDGPTRPSYRFCPDVDSEFVERSGNMREREFDGREREFEGPRMKLVSNNNRRMRNIEEQQDGNYNRPGGRVWHDDGLNDASNRGKRRRF